VWFLLTGPWGFLDALLPEALRLLMIKSDGSVMVHADTGGYKPQNCRV
jgi:RecB family endonuclease NucS